MSWYCGYSLNQLLAEINTSAPNRNKASDGSIGDQAHQNRTSDHNPCKCHNAVCARDFTHDPAGGFDSYAFADWLRQRCATGREVRVKYIISNRRIASPNQNWVWRTYSGSNPHSQHAHVSVLHGPENFNEKKLWGWRAIVPEPPPPSTGGVFTVQGYRLEVVEGTRGKMALLCQQMINDIAGQGLDEDGYFGPQSVSALKNVQTVLGVPADGQCGPKTWQAFENGIKVQAEAGDWID